MPQPQVRTPAPPIYGVQAFRTPSGFLLRCWCGWRSIDHASPFLAGIDRDEHEQSCAQATRNWSKEFPGGPEYLSEVRQFTATVLCGRDGSDVAVSVANELATNAIQHSRSGEPGGEFVLRITTSDKRCQLRVIDQGAPTSPARHELTDTELSGRGLAMVELMSDSWGVEGDEASRSVWAVIEFGAATCL